MQCLAYSGYPQRRVGWGRSARPASRKRLREQGYVTELSVGCFLEALANLLVNLGAERA